jgi:tetratricopeptide (TPR) repeat protein
MPESTCLHIQDRESGPIRVVELPWISVRIGRATYCEVRLSGEDLAEEICRLTRRGRCWNLVPTGGRGFVVLEGRTVRGPCPMPFDVPFQIGRYCLTLRHDVAAEPDWEIYPASAFPQIAAPQPLAPLELAYGGDNDHDRPGAGPTSDSELARGALRPGRDSSRWEARWKAAEAHLKTRTTEFRVAREGHGAPLHSPFDAIASQERPTAAARPSGATTPLIDPMSRPIPTPRVPRIEPGWSPPQPQQPLADASPPGRSKHNIDRPVPPVPTSASVRFEPTWTGPPEPSPTLPLAPSPSWTDWIARERPTDPAVGRRFSEPVRPSAPESGADLPEASSDAPECDVLYGVPSREVSLFEDPEFELPDFGSESPDSRFPIEEDRGAQNANAEAIGDVQAANTDTIGDVPNTNAEVIDGVGNEILESGISDPESDHSTAASAPEPLVSRRESDPRPEGLSRVDERTESEACASLDKPSGGDRVRDRREATPSRERFDDPFRPIEREPRNRRPDRARAGPERRSADEVVWPSVKDILANHRASAGPKPAVLRRRQAAQPLPTVPREPGQWSLPLWLAWPPLAVAFLIAGLASCVLSWCWVVDASSAAIVTHRLMTPDGSGRRRPLPASVVPPDGRWLTTTAQHLAHWAIFLRGSEADPDRPAPDLSSMLTRALQISPMDPMARLALAQDEQTGSRAPASIRTLGLSRDAVSLAWSARRLLGAGKKDAALRLYEQALTVASANGLSRTATPRFHDDLATQRYLLPGEDAVRDIVADMASRGDWTFREWSKGLPQNPTVLIATARLLREQRRDEALPLLELLLKADGAPSMGGAADPRALAARAEALAMMGSRLKDAEQEYRQAIERVDNDLIRRSWWFNLADIARRLNDESQRQSALLSAMATRTSDDISRRVISIQRAADSLAPMTIPSAKAN